METPRRSRWNGASSAGVVVEPAPGYAQAFVTRRLLVRGIRIEAEGVLSYELCEPDGGELPAVQAGAHVDVHIPGGFVRAYSLAGNPRDRSNWLIAVLRQPTSKGGSRALHQTMRVGAEITVGQPRDSFGLVPGARHSVLLAGGIGIAPLIAIAYELSHRDASFELHYSARSRRHGAFLRTLERIVPPDRLHLYFHEGEGACRLDAGALLARPQAGAHVYHCGPPAFMDACEQASRHWPDGTVHGERFAAPTRPAAAPTDGAFEVTLARSGITVQVPAGQSVLRAIELAGVRVPSACLAGICGRCRVPVLGGAVEHNDHILDVEERSRCMTVCVSRPADNRLVLDL